MAEKRNLHDVLDQVPELWSPQIVGEVDNYDIKAANVAGEFPSTCTTTPTRFLVVVGRLHLDLPDRTVTLDSMDLFTVPRGVRHRPQAEPGTRIVMVEPRGTSQDGTDQGNPGRRL